MAIKQSLKEVKATTEKPNDFFASVFMVEKSGTFFHWNSFFIGDSGEVVPEIEVAVKEVMEQTDKVNNNRSVGLDGIHSNVLR